MVAAAFFLERLGKSSINVSRSGWNLRQCQAFTDKKPRPFFQLPLGPGPRYLVWTVPAALAEVLYLVGTSCWWRWRVVSSGAVHICVLCVVLALLSSSLHALCYFHLLRKRDSSDDESRLRSPNREWKTVSDFYWINTPSAHSVAPGARYAWNTMRRRHGLGPDQTASDPLLAIR